MLRGKEGQRLFRKVKVSITFPEKIFPVKTLSNHAGPGKGFGPDGIDEILMKVTDQLDTLYPWWEFRMIELAPVGRTARFSFSFAGYRTDVAFPDAKIPQMPDHIPASEVFDGPQTV